MVNVMLEILDGFLKFGMSPKCQHSKSAFLKVTLNLGVLASVLHINFTLSFYGTQLERTLVSSNELQNLTIKIL